MSLGASGASGAAGQPAGGGPWRDAIDEVAPTVLLIGGWITSPPFYVRMRWRLLDRGAAAVVVAPVWLPDWLLAPWVGLGPIVARSGRALRRAGEISLASPLSRGAPVLVVGHSAGGVVARLLTSPEPFEGRRLGGATRMGAIVTLGTPHHVDADVAIGRRLSEVATDFAERVVPGPAFAPTTGYLAVTSRYRIGRPDGDARERQAYRLYRRIVTEPGGTPIEGDGLVPRRSASLAGVETIILDGIAHGQSTHHPWYGSPEALDAWWPRAIEVWRAALRARVGYHPTRSRFDPEAVPPVSSEVAGWSSGSSSGS